MHEIFIFFPILTQHSLNLSTLLQEYITNTCSCGHITVTVIVTSCTDNRAVYTIQLNGVMATEAALLLITDMDGLIEEGLDLGIAVLYLEEHDNSLESNCEDHKTPLGLLAVIATLSTIIAMLLILLLICVVYWR